MKTADTPARSRPAGRARGTQSKAGAKGAAVEAPRYGIDFLDRGTSASVVPVQLQTNCAPAENRTGMPDSLKAGLEQLSGLDLSGVRVHYNSDKPAQLNALAYTQGQDIEVGSGQERHLPHEGWHAVQQMQGRVQPTMQAKGNLISDDPALEHEADQMGAKAATQKNPRRFAILQKESAKNQCDPKALSVTVQRLALKERPVRATEPPITKSTHLQGGNKGELFVLERGAEKLVVKFQNEDPLEALAGTEIMSDAGAETPGVREAEPADLDACETGLEKGIGASARGEFAAERAAKKYSLLMEFATGETIKKLRDDRPLDLIKALGQLSFQQGLGRIIAADVFAGNPDRLFARWEGAEPTGWYHEENLFIDTDDVDAAKAVAIDNAFSPRIIKSDRPSKPWGLHAGGAGFQTGSTAAAHPETFRTEAKLVYLYILKTIRKAHRKNTEVVKAVRRARRLKDAFAEAVEKAGTEAMGRILDDVEKWQTHGLLAERPEKKKELSERVVFLRRVQQSSGTVQDFLKVARELGLA